MALTISAYSRLNAAIVVAAAAAVVSWTWYLLLAPGRLPADWPTYSPGDPLADVQEFQEYEAPILVAIYVHSTCPVCQDNMGFYREVIDWVARTGASAPPVLFASREPLPQLVAYLAENGLAGQTPVHLGERTNFRHVPVPALLLLDRDHMLLRIWEGRLDDSARQEALGVLDDAVRGL